jgi:hypothetical protein
VEFVKIVALGVLASVLYGVVHDQITARICIEYFTIGHPQLVHTTSPTLLGLAWGIAATWWVGLPLGFLLALAARRGTRPRLSAGQVGPLIFRLLASVALLAFAVGLLVYFLATHGYMALSKDWADLLPTSARIPFLVDAFTHLASYAFGIIGGVIVAVLTYRRRRSMEAA